MGTPRATTVNVRGTETQNLGYVLAEAGMVLEQQGGGARTISSIDSDGKIVMTNGDKNYGVFSYIPVATATSSYGWPTGVNCFPLTALQETGITTAESP